MKYFIFSLISGFIFFSFSTPVKQKIYMIGDSTMANKKAIDAPETGWGQVFDKYFTDEVEIHNHAVNGRSTKSFRDLGHWKVVLDQLQKDDYVFIQFGHNDSKEDDPVRYAPAKTDYRSNLIRYIEEIRSKGAIPLLLTPVERRKFANDTFVEQHCDYPMVVKEVSKLKNVDLIDIHSESKKIIESHGEEASGRMFMHVPAGFYPKFPEGITDNTHFTPYGANLIAAKVAQMIMDQRLPLRAFLKKSAVPQKYFYEMPQVIETHFKPDTFDIRKYGAESNAFFNNSSAIQSAIDNAYKNGGGVILIPPGFWTSGPIVLKSNINLHVSVGSILQFSEDRNDYPMVETTWEGEKAYRCQAPISAMNQTNIALTGGGTIDGAGQVWKSVKRSKLTNSQWQSLIKSGGIHDENNWYPSQSSMTGHLMDAEKRKMIGTDLQKLASIKDFLRPNFISFANCDIVLIDGPTINNSPAWTIHPLLCDHIIVRNTTVKNPWYGQNNDAIDFESCRNGILENCSFDTGDDAITIKSGRDKEGRDRGVPTENFIIRNNTVFHGHGGFVIGSEMSGDVRNMYVSDCNFLGTDIGLRFKTTRGRGGAVHDIYMANINMSQITGEAILFNMYYAAKDPVPLEGETRDDDSFKAEPVTEGTPDFYDFYMDNVHCIGAEATMFINGLPERNIRNVYLSNSSFKTTNGIKINYADGIHLSHIEIEHDKDLLLNISNSRNISFNNMVVKDNSSGTLGKISGSQTTNIKFEGMSPKIKKEDLSIDKNISSKAISIK